MIELENLTKRYGNLIAVDRLNCTIEPGKLYGFLGVNGAGKTTTMNMITGCLAPTEGSVTVCGENLFLNPVAAKRHIGYLPERPPLYPDLTVREYLSFVADAKGVSRTRRRKELTRVMEQVNILPVADKMIRNLSKGYWQRVGIAQAILGDPEILILDEPTASLDPRQIVEIRRLIRSLKGKHTILLSSHILSEVAELADVILILSEGKLVAMDSLAGLQADYLHTDTVKLTVRCSAARCESVLRKISGAQKVTVKECGSLTEAEVECPKGVDLRESIFFAFSELRCPILSMTLHEASLEEVFLTATRPEESSPLPRFKLAVGRTSQARRPAAPTKKPAERKTAAPTPLPDDPEEDDYKPLLGRKESK
ncbi:MAG: ABC transporter ATP-binding protein [Clostridia bacterium]|nr:ABC transporter ATP-binding protein [Clostridia bacterium]